MPLVSLIPRSVDSGDADDAITLGASYGLKPDEWQETVLRAWLGRRRDGQWSAPTAGLAVPRQNGKNAVVEIRELFGIVVLGEKWLHSAHEVKTARKAFLRLASFFESRQKYPELADLVKEVRKTNGQEAIVLTNGGSVEFIARSKGSGRGFTVDALLFDEAQELGDEALEAMIPTNSAGPLGNPQTIYTGTPPGPKATGEVFTRLHDAGHAGKDKRLCWLEWGAPRGCNLDNRAMWARANPAYGYRLNFDVIEAERTTFDDAGFARERLGMWDAVSASAAMDPALWAALEIPGVERVGPVAISVDVDPERTHGAIAMYGVDADGVGVSGVMEHRAGVAWIIPRLVEIIAEYKPVAVVIAAQAPAAALAPDMIALGIDVTFATQSDFARACGAYADAVTDGSLHHRGQPALTDSLLAVVKRHVGDAFVWNRRGSTDITSACAATLARWGYVSRDVVVTPSPAVFFLGEFGDCDTDECTCPEVLPDPTALCAGCGHTHEAPEGDE